MFPALSRVQNDDYRLRETLLRATGGIAFITFPLMVGLGIIADAAVIVILGTKWAAIVPLVMIFCPIGMIHSVTGMNGNILLAKARSDLLLYWNLGLGVVTIGSFLIGSFWGIVGVAVAYGVAMIPLACVGCFLAFRLIDMSFVKWVNNLTRYAINTSIMAVVVLACRIGLSTIGADPYAVLGVTIPVGVLAYFLVSLVIPPPALMDFARILPERIRIGKFYMASSAGEEIRP
jgi:PST family polysaccharide transporter